MLLIKLHSGVSEFQDCSHLASGSNNQQLDLCVSPTCFICDRAGDIGREFSISLKVIDLKTAFDQAFAELDRSLARTDYVLRLPSHHCAKFPIGSRCTTPT